VAPLLGLAALVLLLPGPAGAAGGGAAGAGAGATGATGPAPLIYFLLDTGRGVADKASDIKAINEIIGRTRAALPGCRYFFHLTNFRLRGDNVASLIYDGSEASERLRTGALEAYARATLPDKISEPHRLDQELRLVTAYLRRLEALPEQPRYAERPKWLLAFHDLDWADRERKVSSAGRYLGDGWLVAPQSPLMVEFLSQDNGPWKGTRVLAFLSHGGDLAVRRGKERFYSRMLRMVEADLFYLGPTYAAPAGAAPLAPAYVEALGAGRLAAIAAGTSARVDLLQIIGPDRRAETIDVYR